MRGGRGPRATPFPFPVSPFPSSHAPFEADPEQPLRFDRELHRELFEDFLAEAVHDHRHGVFGGETALLGDRKSTRLNSSHSQISYAVFCLKKTTDTNSQHA